MLYPKPAIAILARFIIVIIGGGTVRVFRRRL